MKPIKINQVVGSGGQASHNKIPDSTGSVPKIWPERFINCIRPEDRINSLQTESTDILSFLDLNEVNLPHYHGEDWGIRRRPFGENSS